jgi:hypothetical protein
MTRTAPKRLGWPPPRGDSETPDSAPRGTTRDDSEATTPQRAAARPGQTAFCCSLPSSSGPAGIPSAKAITARPGALCLAAAPARHPPACPGRASWQNLNLNLNNRAAVGPGPRPNLANRRTRDYCDSRTGPAATGRGSESAGSLSPPRQAGSLSPPRSSTGRPGRPFV